MQYPLKYITRYPNEHISRGIDGYKGLKSLENTQKEPFFEKYFSTKDAVAVFIKVLNKLPNIQNKCFFRTFSVDARGSRYCHMTYLQGICCLYRLWNDISNIYLEYISKMTTTKNHVNIFQKMALFEYFQASLTPYNHQFPEKNVRLDTL